MCQKDIHFKTQPGPVAKNTTPRHPADNLTCDPGSLEQRSTLPRYISLGVFPQLVPVGS